MEKDRAQKIMKEITGLRENLHVLFNENKKVTNEVLLVSTILDQKINSYVKLNNNKN